MASGNTFQPFTLTDNNLNTSGSTQTLNLSAYAYDVNAHPTATTLSLSAQPAAGWTNATPISLSAQVSDLTGIVPTGAGGGFHLRPRHRRRGHLHRPGERGDLDARFANPDLDQQRNRPDHPAAARPRHSPDHCQLPGRAQPVAIQQHPFGVRNPGRPVGCTIALAAPNNASPAFGEAVTFTATVSAPAGTPATFSLSGNVQFYADSLPWTSPRAPRPPARSA